ncbi:MULTISPECIES: CHAT domain-containing protein [unclassified Modestobacter]|uniref:CHAT domain-containing protein n=1 Tax=unclassified Modestobacter TaxID=2643866 RepID=UPI0022AAE322|nr:MULTISPECIES: CHAT domain-containing protein [unclassified Modestobacter]MCZ2824600.1 CHAT domain-containing protein [Modestobacter sp. VKM Ac-2981]MCZ2853872.1 CHAT domain-containing protein [Modestobacter sp. VKM Ac-2982]
MRVELNAIAGLLADCRSFGILEAISRRYVDVESLHVVRYGMIESEAGLERHASVPELKKAIGLIQRALADRELFLAPPRMRRELEFRLSLALTRLATSTQSWQALRESIDWAQRGLLNSLPGSPLRRSFQHTLTTNEMIRADWTSDPSSSDSVIESMRSMAAATDVGTVESSVAHEGLGNALMQSFLRNGKVVDLEEAVKSYRRAVADGGAARPSTHGNLAQALFRQYRVTGEATLLNEAVNDAEVCVATTPEDARQLPGRLANLGTLLRERQQRADAHEPSDLWRALGLHRNALELAIQQAPATVFEVANDLALTLLAAAAMTSSGNLINEAVTVARQGFEACPAGHQSYALHAGTLGAALLARHDIDGVPETRHEAVDLLRIATERTSDQDIRKPGRLSNLALALQKSYRAEGSLAALEEAIGFASKAVELAHPMDADREVYFSTLASAHDYRYEIHRDRRDLAGAINHFHSAVEAAPDQSEGLPVHLSNLASSLMTRYWLGEYAEDLDAALEYFGEALERAGSTSSSRPLIQAQAVEALVARFRRDGKAGDADRAVELASHAAELAPLASGDHYAALIELGHALSARADATGSPSDDEKAKAAWLEVYETSLDGFASAALAAAIALASRCEAVGDSSAAAHAYKCALEAERRVYQAQVLREDKEAWLSNTRTIFVDAAFAFARVADYQAAVLALESGRVRLLSERLDRDGADLEEFARRGHSGLGEAFRAAVERVNALDVTLIADKLTSDYTSLRRETYDSARQAQRELESILQNIRRLPEMSDFLAPTSWEDVCGASGVAPLAYFVAGETGGLILLVRPTGIQCLSPQELPDFTAPGVLAFVSRLLDDRENNFPAWEGTLDDCLKWLWKAAVGPFLKLAADCESVDVVATGLLALLPLHAASTDSPRGRVFADEGLVWRYVPSGKSRPTTSGRSRHLLNRKSLVVYSPDQPNHEKLRGADEEARALLGSREVVGLSGADATVDNVLTEMRGVQLVHFACHAEANLWEPLSSAFILAGEDKLSVRQLLGVTRGELDLAVLAACESGFPGPRIPDELVALSSALLVAGSTAVVASLWRVSDVATHLLMTEFYRRMEEGASPSVALRDSQVWLRMHGGERSAGPLSSPVPNHVGEFAHPSLWAGFTYVGGR